MGFNTNYLACLDKYLHVRLLFSIFLGGLQHETTANESSLTYIIYHLIIAISGAAVLQIFAPEYMGSHAAYGISTGWQREIGFWNIAVLVILITTYRHYNWIYLQSILLALILGGIGIGTNHFIHYLQMHETV